MITWFLILPTASQIVITLYGVAILSVIGCMACAFIDPPKIDDEDQGGGA